MSYALALELQLTALVLGVALVLGIAAGVLTWIEKTIQHAMTDKTPTIRP